MKNKYENLDSLLNQNAARQLAAVDSDRLHADIRWRLDHAQQLPSPCLMQPFVLRWAVGLSVAAAMVMLVFILRSPRTRGIELSDGQCAAVKLIEPDTQAKIEIGQLDDIRTSVTIQPVAQKAQVSFSQSAPQIALCNVTIINQNGHAHKEKNRHPSWVIIIPSQEERPENETVQEQGDIACLL